MHPMLISRQFVIYYPIVYSETGGNTMVSYCNTSEEVRNSGAEIALIPLGSIEQHGPHLPIGTDFFLATAFSEAVAEKLGNVLLYPAIPFSNCYEHKGSAGTLGFRPQTVMNMIEDLVMGLYDQGIKKVAVLMAHGGIFSVPPIVRQLNALHDDLQDICLHMHFGDCEKEKDILQTKVENHAGEHETSLMMHLHPELVKTEKIAGADCMPDYPQAFLNFAPILSLTKSGAWGNPSLASPEKGELFFGAQLEATVNFINEAFRICKKEAW